MILEVVVAGLGFEMFELENDRVECGSEGLVSTTGRDLGGVQGGDELAYPAALVAICWSFAKVVPDLERVLPQA